MVLFFFKLPFILKPPQTIEWYDEYFTLKNFKKGKLYSHPGIAKFKFVIVDFKNDTSPLNDQNNLTHYPIGGKVSLLKNWV